MLLTPRLHDRGFYEFKLPWKPVPGVSYECIAIRSFPDIYNLGVDVYTTYYERVGLRDGVDGFSFNNEVKLNANIITLKGTDNSVIYIPDTFITKLPDASLIPYSEVILAVSLGALPDSLSLEGVKQELMEVVNARMNITSSVQVGTIPLLKNPTLEEHLLLERTRLGNSQDPKPNYKTLYEELKVRNSKLNATITILLDKMRKDGVIASYTRPSSP